jgi:hypothetical protein
MPDHPVSGYITRGAGPALSSRFWEERCVGTSAGGRSFGSEGAQDQVNVSIRLPFPVRIFVLVYSACWTAFVTLMMIIGRPVASVLVGIAFICFGFFASGRMLRLGIDATGNGRLIVRNGWTTRAFSRSDIEDFRLLKRGSAFGQKSIVMLLTPTHDSLIVDVTRTVGLGFGRSRVDRQLQLLRDWHRRTA